MSTNFPSTRSTSLIPVVFDWRKFDGGVHWSHQTFFLGEDQYGKWFAQTTGAHSFRPGLEYVTETDTVMLVSPDGDFVAKFFPPGREDGMLLYVDIAHDVTWHPELGKVTGIDMDLDVLHATDERGIWIEDIEEFQAHKERYSYPEDLINHSWMLATEILEKVINEEGPYDTVTAPGWFNFFTQLKASV